MDKHIVTDKQIDAMVAGGMLRSDWEIVAKLGIKQCKKCKGVGKLMAQSGELQCPTCHGHGWVVTNEVRRPLED